jgi:hypothetical protein
VDDDDDDDDDDEEDDVVEEMHDINHVHDLETCSSSRWRSDGK